MSSGKLLLHTCCAGCAIYSFDVLCKKFDHISGYFFNPNIHPHEEYKKRRQALKTYADKYHKDVLFPPHEPYLYYRAIYRKESTPSERCTQCWHLRLRETARAAREGGYERFTTTLLISPYQDHMMIKVLGEKAAQEFAVPFHYEDLRGGFRDSAGQLKKLGLYHQKYCGCEYSLQERRERLKNKKRTSKTPTTA